MSVPTRGRPSSSTGTGRVKVCSHGACKSTTWPNLAEVGVEFIRFPKPCLNYRNSLPESNFRKLHNLIECRECGRAARWVLRCRRDKGLISIDQITPQTYICSKHFSSVAAAKSLEEDPHPATKVRPVKGKSQLRQVVEDTKVNPNEDASQNIGIYCEPFPIRTPRKAFVGPWKTSENIAAKNRPRFLKPWKCVEISLKESDAFAEEYTLNDTYISMQHQLVQAANNTVAEVLTEKINNGKTGSRKRGRYCSYTNDQRTKIAKYATENGDRRAQEHFKNQGIDIPLRTLGTWKKQFIDETKEQNAQPETMKTKKRGRPTIIESSNEMQDATCYPADENDLYDMSSLCSVVDVPESEASELHFKALADFFLDGGWTVELAKNKITLLKRRDWSIVISITITASSLEVYVFGKVVDLPDYIKSMALTQGNIRLAIDIIKNYPLCKGVDDPELVKFLQKGSDEVEGLYCDGSNSYRTSGCSGLIFEYDNNLCLSCMKCTEMLSAKLEKSKDNICVMKSATHDRFVGWQQQPVNIKEENKVIQSQGEKIAKLQRRLSCALKNGKVKQINSVKYLRDVVSQSTHLLERTYGKSSLVSVFVKSQLELCVRKGRRGQRYKWHPEILRWCQLIRSQSPLVYRTLRDSKILLLPDESTLETQRKLLLKSQNNI